MFPLSTESVCLYLCICMSTLTLTAAILALYILISIVKDKSDNGGDNRAEYVRQENRRGVEQLAPLCLTQL